MNLCVHADVMVLSPDTGDGIKQHPFTYACILGIFHAEVLHTVPGSWPVFKTMEVLWVRWFRYDMRWKAGLKQCHLHRVYFVLNINSDAYGFLDPDKVI